MGGAINRNVHVIGGAAGIGKWLVSHVFEHAYVYDLSQKALELLPSTARPCLVGPNTYSDYEQQFGPADWILLGVPLTVFEDTVNMLVPVLKDGSLVVTLSSIQDQPVRVLRSRLPAGRSLVGCHPLFGHTVHSPVGQIVALTEFDERQSQHREFRRALSERGLIVTQLELAEHDRYMAYVQALTHFCLLGFAATLGRSGVHPGDLLKLRTPNFQFLFAFASRIIKQSSTTSGAIQSTADAALIRKSFLDCLSDLHGSFGAAKDVQQHARVIEGLRAPLTGAEVDEGAEVAAVAVDSIQAFDQLVHKYKMSAAPFLFRNRITGRFKVVRILEIRHDEICYQESTRAIKDNDRVRFAIGLNVEAVKNYRAMGITFPRAVQEVIKKRNIKLVPSEEVDAFYREQLLPITTEYNLQNPLGHRDDYFEEWLPLVVRGLWSCQFLDGFRKRGGIERVTLRLTFNPNTKREQLLERVRRAVEERLLTDTLGNIPRDWGAE